MTVEKVIEMVNDGMAVSIYRGGLHLATGYWYSDRILRYIRNAVLKAEFNYAANVCKILLEEKDNE